MKLSALTPELIRQAAELIELEGIPKDQVWSQYYAVVDLKEYPFKYLVYRALALAGETEVVFESNDGYRNYLAALGFPIQYYKEGYNFFTSSELDFFSAVVRKPYRKADAAHRNYPNKLNALIAKVNYWAEAIRPQAYRLRKDTNWLTGFTANMKPYFWPRIYKDRDQDVFFNVEVNGENRFIGYKLDGYYETVKKLKPEQIKILNDFKKEIQWDWPKISFEDLNDYDWTRLIRETRDYVERYEDFHDHLKKRLYKQQVAAVLSWNTFRWQRPSGMASAYHYDEWLFDADRVSGFWKYGYVTAIASDPLSSAGRVFDINLITTDPLDGQRYWVARLQNVEVIPTRVAIEMARIYETNGWVAQMQDDLREITGDTTILLKDVIEHPERMFNVRFNAAQLNRLPLSLLAIDDGVAVITGQHFLKPIDESTGDDLAAQANAPFSFDGSGSTEADLKKRGKRSSFTTERELEFKHNELQRKLLLRLQQLHGKTKVKRECNAFGGCRIDVVRETATGYIFYEIKTYNNLLTSIRQGIGQLLEYNLFPKSQQAEQMVLVGHLAATAEIRDYILHLKSFINLNFTYMHFDLESECIVSEI